MKKNNEDIQSQLHVYFMFMHVFLAFHTTTGFHKFLYDMKIKKDLIQIDICSIVVVW